MINTFVFFTNIKGLIDIDSNLIQIFPKEIFENGNDIFIRYEDGGYDLVNTRGFKPENYNKRPFLIIINDEQKLPEKAIGGISNTLKHFISLSENLYVVYHNRTSDLNKPGFEVIASSKIAGTSVPQSHISGSLYDKYLSNLLVQTSNDLNNTILAFLKEIPNRTLERKLVLLHDCLHPESAANTDTFWLSTEQKELVNKLISLKDNLSPDYIKVLTDLRILLLGS